MATFLLLSPMLPLYLLRSACKISIYRHQPSRVVKTSCRHYVLLMVTGMYLQGSHCKENLTMATQVPALHAAAESGSQYSHHGCVMTQDQDDSLQLMG